MRLSILVSIAPVFLCSLFASATPPAEPIEPGGVSTSPFVRRCTKGPVVLVEPTRIEADAVQIDHEVVTNGFPLNINCRILRFGPSGKIVGFKNAATAGLNGAGKPRAGTPGPREGAWAPDGLNGDAGNPGQPGVDGWGSDGRFSGEIRLFASVIEGNVVIDATGQNGGRGGDGAKGQDGGDGGPGSLAGQGGGQGGQGGNGGRGGDGGKGGPPVPNAVLSASPLTGLDHSVSQVALPGSGGTPGDSGAPGDAGRGGQRGAKFVKATPFNRNIEFEPPDGRPGKPGSAGSVGKPGEPGAVPSREQLLSKIGRDQISFSASYRAFEQKRWSTVLAWYGFHWVRELENLWRHTHEILKETRAEKDDADIDSVLGDAQDEAVRNLRSVWEDDFHRPLNNLAAKLRKSTLASNRRKLEEISWVLDQTKEYTQLLLAFEKREARSGAGAETLAQLLKIASKKRTEKLAHVSRLCRRYINQVLLSDDFRRNLSKATFHFSIPACEEVDELTKPRNVVSKPIVLSSDLAPYVSPSMRDSWSDEVVAATVKTSGIDARRWLESLFFGKEAWAGPEQAFGVTIGNEDTIPTWSLGQGNLNPKARIFSARGRIRQLVVPKVNDLTLESLGTELHAIAQMVVESAE